MESWRTWRFMRELKMESWRTLRFLTMLKIVSGGRDNPLEAILKVLARSNSWNLVKTLHFLKVS